MNDVINVQMKGIKCDAPDCDYKDLTVPDSEYEHYVGKPCPKCGANLLTRADLKALRRLKRWAKHVNRLTRWLHITGEGQRHFADVHMNGSGKIKLKIRDDE